jgi:hypothetical protein
MKFSPDLLQHLSDFVVRSDTPALDQSAIYFVDFEKLAAAVIPDPQIVPYLILNALKKEGSAAVSLIYLLRAFDEAKVPATALFLSYPDIQLAKKIRRVVCLEPNSNFVALVTRHPQLLDRTGYFHFVKNLSEFGDCVGHISRQLPLTAHESLTKPDSVSRAIVNGRERHVRLHANSIQILGNTETVQSYELASVEVIPASHIEQVTRPTEVPNTGRTVFTITPKAGQLGGMTYQIEQPKESALFEGTLAMTRRSQALNAVTNRVKVDTSTLQWLMLILGFVNMVNDHEVRPIVRKSALDLVSAVFSTFTLIHELNVTKVAIESLPENLLGFVTALSEDVASHNPQCYDGFLSEFFNVYKYVEKQCKPVTLHFIRPWIKY